MRKGRILHRGAAWVKHAEHACRSLGADAWAAGSIRRRAGAALLIERCGAVHTVGMRFSLDLVFLDRSWRVTAWCGMSAPVGRWYAGGWHAKRVVEAGQGVWI